MVSTLIIPLNGLNYGTWKVQTKLTLLREGIVQGTEEAPTEESALAKYNGRRYKALATLGLSLHPTLLYLLDAIDDPKEAWDKLGENMGKQI